MVQFLKNNFGDWNITVLRDLFNGNLVNDICRMHWANNNEEHRIILVGNKDGAFSVKSFY